MDRDILIGFMELPAVGDQFNGRGRAPLFPMGQIVSHPTVGTAKVTEEDLQAFADAFNAAGKDAVIDYDHSFHYGKGSLAAGWIKPGTAYVADGMLWGEIEWTPQATEQIRSVQYRYISPEWNFDGKALGRMKNPTLVAATLTNRPFFANMPAVVASQMSLASLMQRLGQEIGADMSDDDVIGMVSSVLAAMRSEAQMPADMEDDNDSDEGNSNTYKRSTFPAKGAEMNSVELAAMLGLSEEASEDEIKTAIADAQAKAKAVGETPPAPDPPPSDEDKDTALAMATQARRELHEMRREAVIGSAVADLRIMPAERSFFEKQFDVDPEGVTAHIGSLEPRAKGPIGTNADLEDTEQMLERLGPLEFGTTIEGTEIPVEPNSFKVHTAALEVLEGAGKILDYTEEDYIAAVKLGERKTGIPNVHTAMLPNRQSNHVAA